MPLDDDNQPPARLVAQLRLAAKSKGLPEAAADAAAAANMTAAAFTAAAPMLTRMLQLGNITFKGQGENPTMTVIRDAMSEGLEADALEERILNGISAAKIAQDGPQPAMLGARTMRDFEAPHEKNAKMADALAAKISARLGLNYEPTSGREFMNHSLMDMKAVTLEAAGHGRLSRNQVVQMLGTHSRDDMPLITGSGMTAVLRNMMPQAPVAIAACARVVEAQDYRAGHALSISGSGALQKIGEGGEIKYSTVNEEGEVKALPEDYGQIIRLGNKLLIDDGAALGALGDMARLMLKAANELKRTTLIAPILANSGLGQTLRDGQTLFHSTHGNVAASGGALSLTTLSAARTAMRRQTDSKGNLLAIEPAILLCAPEQETLAEQVLAEIAATKTSDTNPFAGRLEVVCEPGLPSGPWYVLASPAMYDGLVMAYLGQETPRVEAQESWGTLGIEYRLVWAIGAAFHGYQSWYRNAGA